MNEKLLAAPRDAQWYARPNVHTTKRYHVLVRDGKHLAMACGQSPLHATDYEIPAASVPTFQRCKKPACARLWP